MLGKPSTTWATFLALLNIFVYIIVHSDEFHNNSFSLKYITSWTAVITLVSSPVSYPHLPLSASLPPPWFASHCGDEVQKELEEESLSYQL